MMAIVYAVKNGLAVVARASESLVRLLFALSILTGAIVMNEPDSGNLFLFLTNGLDKRTVLFAVGFNAMIVCRPHQLLFIFRPF